MRAPVATCVCHHFACCPCDCELIVVVLSVDRMSTLMRFNAHLLPHMSAFFSGFCLKDLSAVRFSYGKYCTGVVFVVLVWYLLC